MSPFVKIGIALGITVLSVIAAVWQIANVRGAQGRGRRRGGKGGGATASGQDATSHRRQGDQRALSGPEKRLFQESQRLLAQGKVAAAARILEQLGMLRESIQVLEDHGMIHEAAQMLMRMQRHNRAGVIYARYGMWDHAAQCFKKANMPLEVAKCAREAGDLATAAQYFETVGRIEDAGECYEQLNEFHKAARLFSNAGQRQRAMSLYNRLAAAAANLAAIEFEDREIQEIVDYLGDGNVDQGLTAVVVSRNRLTNVILNLVGKDMVRQAAELYTRSTVDIGPQLIAEVNVHDASGTRLAEVFLNVSAYYYAGIIYERMNQFAEAAESFERAEDFERAAYCYERSGHDGMAKALKEKARATPFQLSRNNPGGLALASVGASDHNAFGADTSDSTALIDANRPQLARPSLPPPMPTTPAKPAAPRRLSLADASDDDAPPASSLTPPPPSPLAPLAPPAAEAPQVGLEEGRAAFHRAKFFADLDYEQKNKLWEIGETLEFGANEPILTYNDEPRGIYVIVQGSVSCYKHVGDKEAYVDQMGEAESFGELWLLADQPTAVRFVASKATRIHVIEREAFTELLDNDGTIARKVYKRFTLRLLKRLLTQQNQKKNQTAS